MKLQNLVSALSVSLAIAGTAMASDDTIFAPPAQPAPATQAQVLTYETLNDSPTMRDRRDEVMAAADAKLARMQADGALTPGQVIAIKGWFKELPFQRIIDLKISFLSGFPDTVGACLSVNPVYYISVDACAGTIILLSGISAHVASRFLHYESIKGKQNSDGSTAYWGDEISVGPSVGVRDVAIFGFDTSGTALGIDALISAEWVHWFSRYFGLGLTLDAGATYLFDEQGQQTTTNLIPNVKLSIGLSF